MNFTSFNPFGVNFNQPQFKGFKENNHAICDAILNDDVESLSNIVLAEDDAINQEFGFKDQYLPIFISSVPPIISVAAYFNAINCVKFLIDNGADLEKKDIMDRPLIHFAVASRSMDMVRLIDQNEDCLKQEDKCGNLPIHVACQFGFLDCVKYIFMKTSINTFNSRNGVSSLPLLIAAYYGHLEIIKYMKEIGINLLESNSSGATALHFASLGGHPDVVQYLIDEGLPVKWETHDSETPLFYACKNGSLSTVKILIKNNATYKRKGKKKPPFLEAARNGFVDVVDYFISQGTDIYLTDSQGNSIFDFAESSLNDSQLNLLKYLISKGFKIPSYQANNIFRYSLRYGKFNIFKRAYELWPQNLTNQALDLLFGPYSNHFECIKIIEFLLKSGKTSFTKTFLNKARRRFYKDLSQEAQEIFDSLTQGEDPKPKTRRKRR